MSIDAWRGWRSRHAPSHKPWQIERAELARRHEQSAKEWQRRAERRYYEGVEHGKQAALERVAEAYAANFDLQKYVYESAMHELAHKAGEGLGISIARAIDPYRVQMSMEEQGQRAMLDAAMVSAEFSARSYASDMTTVLQINFTPPVTRFCIALPIPGVSKRKAA